MSDVEPYGGAGDVPNADSAKPLTGEVVSSSEGPKRFVFTRTVPPLASSGHGMRPRTADDVLAATGPDDDRPLTRGEMKNLARVLYGPDGQENPEVAALLNRYLPGEFQVGEQPAIAAGPAVETAIAAVTAEPLEILPDTPPARSRTLSFLRGQSAG